MSSSAACRSSLRDRSSSGCACDVSIGCSVLCGLDVDSGDSGGVEYSDSVSESSSAESGGLQRDGTSFAEGSAKQSAG